MTPAQVRQAIVLALKRIAPELDEATLDPAVNLRDQLDLDSMDFLNFVVRLHEQLGVAIPESDYPHLYTLDAAVAYLTRVATTDAPPGA